MYLILTGFMLLFFKMNFTLFDDSLVYIGTNFIGYVLLRIAIENSDDAEDFYMKDSLWFYLTLNLIILFCRAFDISIDQLTFDYIESYLLASTLLFVHIYLFVYPIYLFSKCVVYLELQSRCIQSQRLQNLLKVSLGLVLFITISSSWLVDIQYLWIMVISMQLTALLLLKKYALPFN